ncbi:MAG: J domain-containing protein, partial [Acidimicrobiales bacterium]
LSREATPEEIRSAYLRISKQVHTDKGGTDALFRQVNTAYEVLSDPRTRVANSEPVRTPVPIESVHRFRRFRTLAEEKLVAAGAR